MVSPSALELGESASLCCWTMRKILGCRARRLKLPRNDGVACGFTAEGGRIACRDMLGRRESGLDPMAVVKESLTRSTSCDASASLESRIKLSWASTGSCTSDSSGEIEEAMRDVDCRRTEPMLCRPAFASFCFAGPAADILELRALTVAFSKVWSDCVEE